MANKPADTVEQTEAVEVDSEVTPQARHKRKLILEEKKRKKENVVKEQWLQIISDHHNRKGGKVRLCKRMTNGNVHRLYLGREKQVEKLVKQYVAKGMKIEK